MGCLTPSGKDAGPFVYIEMCQKMIAENYGLLFLLLLLVTVLVFILIYFISEMKTSLSLYWKSLPEGKKTPHSSAQDDELEDTVNTKMADSKFDKSTNDFYKSVEEKYNTYNKEKTEYIRTTYEKDNDDIIDRKLLFPQYDNYDYTNK